VKEFYSLSVSCFYNALTWFQVSAFFYSFIKHQDLKNEAACIWQVDNIWKWGVFGNT
jgi:hypothetical protein